jgi:hypothetical protein
MFCVYSFYLYRKVDAAHPITDWHMHSLSQKNEYARNHQKTSS